MKLTFNRGYFNDKVNSTLIALIPKVCSPEKIAPFRPVSLPNGAYKTITKVLVACLRLMLDGIISPA